MSCKPATMSETLANETLLDVEKLQEIDELCKQCKSDMEGQKLESLQPVLDMACGKCLDLRASLPTLMVLAAEASI